MLRSVPAFDLETVAERVGVYPGALKAAVGQFGVRGRGAERAVSLSYHHGPPLRRRIVLGSAVCPPWAARRAAWDRSGFVRRAAPGVAGWSSRDVDSAAPPRIAYAKAAAIPAPRVASKPDCPPAIATRLIADHPRTADDLAATTPRWVVLAAGVTAGDDPAVLLPARARAAAQDW